MNGRSLISLFNLILNAVKFRTYSHTQIYIHLFSHSLNHPHSYNALVWLFILMLAVGDYSIVPICVYIYIFLKYIDYTGWLSNSIKLISVFIAFINNFLCVSSFFSVCVCFFFFALYILVYNIVNMIKYTYIIWWENERIQQQKINKL